MYTHNIIISEYHAQISTHIHISTHAYAHICIFDCSHWMLCEVYISQYIIIL